MNPKTVRLLHTATIVYHLATAAIFIWLGADKAIELETVKKWATVTSSVLLAISFLAAFPFLKKRIVRRRNQQVIPWSNVVWSHLFTIGFHILVGSSVLFTSVFTDHNFLEWSLGMGILLAVVSGLSFYPIYQEEYSISS